MLERLYKIVLDHPYQVIFFTIIFAALSSLGAKHLEFKADYRVFFSPDNPELATFNTMQRIYSKNDNVVFILSPKNAEVFTPVNLAAIHWLTNEAWQIPYSTRVDSITNFQHTVAVEDDLLVEDLVLDPELISAEDMPRIKNVALNEPLLVNKIVSTRGHVTAVNVIIQLAGKNLVEELPETVAYTRALADRFAERYPEFDLHLSGMIMLNNSFEESAYRDASTLVPLMFALIALVMICLLRTITGTIVTVLLIILSIIGTMGLSGWAGFYLTGPTTISPVMIMTLAVADCVHILSSFFYHLRQGHEKRQALEESLRINFEPIFLTSITTAIGFLSMNFSDAPPFHDLGNMVAIGVMLAFIFSITFMPAMLILLPIRMRQKNDNGLDFMDAFSGFVIRNRSRLLPFMVVVISTLVIFAPQNRLNDDFIKYFDTTVPFRQAADYMQDNLSGMTTLEISVDSGKSSGINNPEYLRTLDIFSNWLRNQAETDHVTTLSDTIKRLNKNMHGDDPAYYKLPSERELAAQYLLLYELSLPYGLDLNNQLNVDKSSVRVLGTFKNLASAELIQMEYRIYKWFEENAPEYQVSVASPNLIMSHLGQRNIRSMLLATSMALLIISLILGITLRSFKYGLITLVTNTAPAATGFGLWYLINGKVGLGLSVVVGMTLGIVVDYSIHFLVKYHRARTVKNESAIEGVHYAFASVGRALWITTVVLVGGFMLLAQSSFRLNSDMGLLTAITILIALTIDFLLLPPLLIMVDKSTVK